MLQQVHFTRIANNNCRVLLRRALQKKKNSLFAGPTNGLYFVSTSRACWRSCLTTEVKGYWSVANYVVFWDLATCNLAGRTFRLHFRASPILEAADFSEMSVLSNKSAPRYVVKDSSLYSYHCEDSSLYSYHCEHFRFLILQVMLMCGYLGQCHAPTEVIERHRSTKWIGLWKAKRDFRPRISYELLSLWLHPWV